MSLFFFSPYIHCEYLTEIQEVKLTSVKTPQRVGPPGVFNHQSIQNLSVIVWVFLHLTLVLSYLSLLFFGTLHSDAYIFPFLLCFSLLFTDGWMASLTRWTWVWVNSGSWWWTGRPGVLDSWGRKKSDTTERLNWAEHLFSSLMLLWLVVILYIHLSSLGDSNFALWHLSSLMDLRRVADFSVCSNFYLLLGWSDNSKLLTCWIGKWKS